MCLSRTPSPPSWLGDSWQPEVLEHYRNDDAGRAHAVLSKGPLALLERADVVPGSSNQWLLRYRRT